MTIKEAAKAAAAVFCRVRLHSEKEVSKRVAENNFRFDCDTGRLETRADTASDEVRAEYHDVMQDEVTRIRRAEDCCEPVQVPM